MTSPRFKLEIAPFAVLELAWVAVFMPKNPHRPLKKPPVKNATGTRPYTVSAKGQFVIFTDDKENRVTVDAAGLPTNEGKKIYDDGSYKLEKNGDFTYINMMDNKGADVPKSFKMITLTSSKMTFQNDLKEKKNFTKQ